MRILFLCIALLTGQLTIASDLSNYLLPAPKALQIPEGQLQATKLTIHLPGTAIQWSKPLLHLLSNFEQTGIQSKLLLTPTLIGQSALSIKIDQQLKPQAYTLTIGEYDIQLTGGSETGVYYGLLTLQQVGRYAVDHGYWPMVSIVDEPDFERRGVMLDISRDKVPTMKTLYGIVDKLASWKINELQLYTEHTFAYKNHQTVWQDASPMTAEQIQVLDAYCRRHYIDLVPNQNSFGHMKRWLIHEEYEHLAELPQPGKTIWGMMSRTSLSPVEPGSLELMQELYAELLPNFTSQYFNIGCDETVELGVGKSKALCQQKGKGRVYLDFVLELKKEVDKYNRTTQFWGDIILHHPELIPELPKDMVALIWGYEADYPFDKNCPKFQQAGLPYYVCPGTSTWNSIIGRNQNAFANLKNAAVNGKQYGAKGFLNTNWGDQGHWQPLSICYPALLYGAALSWSVESNTEIDIAQHVSLQILNDTSGQSGTALVNLGDAYLKMHAPTDNSNIFHQLLKRNSKSIKTDRWLKRINKTNTEATIAFIEQQLAAFQAAPIQCADADIVRQEVTQACALALHACHLALAKLTTTDGHFSSLDAARKAELKQELEALIAQHQTIWRMRNREGGLTDSANKMKAVLKTYR
ncbi:family 20 glycosylhydrolase [Carboxylicivirga mesophila]|uniref:Family 20 glycosylhydrolase n=1 Tax=Carboxylicivirga mesophila TaxID=1166478 RepID=A0ABS5K9W2_9BACT|nr:family 20 glycosylhydrolase [Carboxylicivirga mesophila]MBS2211813.1 family 20 glycosylhydrolase [Carboxylicivirga mesophila]